LFSSIIKDIDPGTRCTWWNQVLLQTQTPSGDRNGETRLSRPVLSQSDSVSSPLPKWTKMVWFMKRIEFALN